MKKKINEQMQKSGEYIKEMAIFNTIGNFFCVEYWNRLHDCIVNAHLGLVVKIHGVRLFFNYLMEREFSLFLSSEMNGTLPF